MKISIKTSGARAFLCLLMIASSINVFAQTETIESLTAKIEANPKEANNYRARGDLYADLANEGEFPANLPLVARSVADYSAYLRLEPNDAQVLRMRGLARRDLFTEVNTFTLSDTSRAFRLNPRDLEARDEIRSQNAEYRKLYRSKSCREARSKNGFQGHASDEPLTALAEALDAEMTEDVMIALKYLACGANPNYVYPRSREPEFSDFSFFRIEHLIALLEVGANPNRADGKGNTPLMNSLNGLVQRSETIDDAMLEKFKIALDYGANPNARNRRGRSVLSFARQTKNDALVNLLIERGAK